MKVNKKLVAYPVAMAVAWAVGTAHAQTTTPAVMTAEGQTLNSDGHLGDIYSKQGHIARNSSQRLPVMTVVLADDYAVNDEILLQISGTGVTPDIDRINTTTELDKANAIRCSVDSTVSGNTGNFIISHPDQYIEQSAPYQTLRLRVTQKDQTVTTTRNASCVIEGIYLTDASIGAASITAGSLAATDEATIFANWTAYDKAYVIGGSPPTSNNEIDKLAAPRTVAKIRNQFGPYTVVKAWDGVIDVQVAGSQYTRFMANSPPVDSDVEYSATDVLTFTAVDRGSGTVGTPNAYTPQSTPTQRNYFDGAVALARFDVLFAGDFNFVRESSAACVLTDAATGGSTVVGVATINGTSTAGAGTESVTTNCSAINYTYTRTGAQSDGTGAETTMLHTLTATRGTSASPWFVRQDFAVTEASWVVTGFNSVGSLGTAAAIGDTATTLDTLTATGSSSATYSAGSQDPGVWTINGTRVFIPYMPFDTGITRILRVSNIMFTDGNTVDPAATNGSVFNPADVTIAGNVTGVGQATTDSRVGRTNWSAAATEDGATVLYQVWNASGATCTFDGTTKALANATTNIAADFRNGVVACPDILTSGAGTVSAMITIGAPEQGIEVVSAYNVNGDRVQVINNSNGRNNSESNAELGSRRPSGRSDYKQSADLDRSNP